MSIFSFIKNVTGRNDQPSANLAKERLQLIIAHESNGKTPDFLPKLRDELIAVISRYTSVTEDSVCLKLERRGNTDFLEMNLVLGDPVPAKAAPAAQPAAEPAKVEDNPSAALAKSIIAQDRVLASSPAAPVVLQQVETKPSARTALPNGLSEHAAAAAAPAREKVRVESSQPARHHKGKRGRK